MTSRGTQLLPQKHQSELEVLSLQHEIRDKHQQIRKISLRYNQLETQFKSILQNHQAMLNHLQDLKLQIENERERNRNLSKENQKVQLELLAIQTTNGKIEEYKEEIVALKRMNANLEQAMLEQKNMKESKQIAEYKNKIKILKEEYSKIESTSRKQFEKYEASEKIIAAQKEQIKALKKRISELTLELNSLQNENSSLKDRVSVRSDDDDELKQKLAQQQQFLIHKDQTIKNLKETIQKLKDELANMKNLFSDLERKYQNELESKKSPPVVDISTTESYVTEDPYNFTVSHNSLNITINSLEFDPNTYPLDSFLPTFVSVDFYEFKTELTDIIQPNDLGEIPFQTRIICNNIIMNSDLVYHLCTDSVSFDVHLESDGQGTRIGNCTVPLKDLLDKSVFKGRIPIKYTPNQLESVQNLDKMMNQTIGYIDIELAFDVPMSKAIEGTVDVEKLKGISKKSFKSSNAEKIRIEILSAKNLPTPKGNFSPFIRYTFYNFDTYSTQSASSSPNPVFNDEQIFPVERDDQLKEYLNSNVLKLEVFANDKEQIGFGEIPLYKLLVDDLIEKNLTIKNVSGKEISNCKLDIKISRKSLSKK